MNISQDIMQLPSDVILAGKHLTGEITVSVLYLNILSARRAGSGAREPSDSTNPFALASA
jgi:hypothetical protein